MNSYELRFFLLGRVVATGNYDNITQAVEEFEKLPKKDNYTELVDKANLPFLVDFHASNNEAASKLIREHRLSKSIKMSEEKEEIAENFRAAFMKLYPQGREITLHDLHLLTMVLYSPDSVYVTVALRLLTDLSFSFEEYATVLPRLQVIRPQYSEAELLIQKIEKMVREFNEIDEGMGLVGEEDIDEVMEDDFDEAVEEEFDDSFEDAFDDSFEEGFELNDSFMSSDSGVEDDSEELRMEDSEEKRVRWQKLNYAIDEVFTMVLAESLRSGNPDNISFAIEVLGDMHLPLSVYQKYEITSLVHQYAFHCEEAVELWENISNMLEFVTANELEAAFNHILKDAEKRSEISHPTMDLLMLYLTNENESQRVHRVIEVLLTKSIPLELFQHYDIKKFLLDLHGKTDAIMLLIIKIREMEGANSL